MEAFITWLGTYGQVVAFIVQLLYWIVIAVAAIWAVLLFKRLVDFKTREVASSAKDGGSVSADEFVD